MARVTVEGTVSRINSRGNGFGVKEVQSWGDKERVTFWSVFPPKDTERTVVEGQQVRLEGFLGTRVSERDARFVDHTLNQAKVLETSAAPVAVGGSGWNTDETPF